MKQTATNNLTGEVTEIEVVVIGAPTVPELSVDQRRKLEYETNPIIVWGDETLTVDQANQLFLFYRAEAAEIKAADLQELIKAAKTQIRETIN